MKPIYKSSLFLFLGSVLLASNGWAQNVGIGTAAPLDKLHVVGNIRSTTLAGVGNRLVMADPNGTLVISTTPGTTNPAWTILGNAGTSAATNFIGTTDAIDWIVKTNGVERMRFLSTGNIGIGTTTPIARLSVESTTGISIRGFQTGFGSGYLGYGGVISLGAFGSTPGATIYSEEGTATANPSLIAVTRSPASYAANIAYSDVWIAGYFGVDNASTTFNPPGLYGQLNLTSSSIGGFHNAISAYQNRGGTAGNPGYSVGVSGVVNSQNEDAFGVMGRTYCGNLTNTNAGGYFEANNYAAVNFGYAYVATAAGRKIIGAGTVSEIVPTPNHGRITLTCPESPEYWYQDYGTASMVNGHAHVDLDPILADIIVVNNDNPIRVFCTPVDMPVFNGVTITNRTATGFDIVELNGGTNTGTLEYQIVLKPKTNFGEGRFVQAPGPLGLKPDHEPAAARAANQTNPSQIFHWPADQVQYGYSIPKQQPMPVTKSQDPH